MHIKELAARAGVTVRTLHHYDQIGLLRPSGLSPSGYRLYDEQSLVHLQQILFFRELDFSLAEIRDMLHSPGFDRDEALHMQRELLLQKRRRLSDLIALIDRTRKGETPMDFTPFDDTQIAASKAAYADEARERWGHTDAYRQSEKRAASYGKDDWAAIQQESAGIMAQFASLVGTPAHDPAVQALVARWQQHITDRFYPCTDEILCGLGLMYTGDERFQNNIDQHGAGTAALMAEAIAWYTKD